MLENCFEKNEMAENWLEIGLKLNRGFLGSILKRILGFLEITTFLKNKEKL